MLLNFHSVCTIAYEYSKAKSTEVLPEFLKTSSCAVRHTETRDTLQIDYSVHTDILISFLYFSVLQHMKDIVIMKQHY